VLPLVMDARVKPAHDGGERWLTQDSVLLRANAEGLSLRNK